MKRFCLLIVVLSLLQDIHAQQIQFRGPQRDGKFPESGLLKTWPAGGPELLLKIEGIGKGFSSVVTNGRYLYATGMTDTLDYLSCISTEGKILWRVPYGRSWTKSFPDTRSTPTLDGDRIYVVSGTGELNCIKEKDGTVLWKVNVDKEYGADWHNWGVSESPLIVGDKVISCPTGSKTTAVAFDKMTGKPVWQSEAAGGQRAYASPYLYQYENFRFILATTTQYLVALDPETGKIAWKFRYYDEKKYDKDGLIWANMPLCKGRDIFLSMGYDYHNMMLQLNEQGTGVTEKWSNEVLDNHHHGLIEKDGFIYGANWISNSKGKWVCLDWETGQTKYETEWLTKGAIVYADGLCYLMEEKTGTVALMKPDPEKFEIISSFKLEGGSGPFWVHPFLTGGNMYLRHGDVLFVYKIKG
jgi:outer membrane protein assembly factor BamB